MFRMSMPKPAIAPGTMAMPAMMAPAGPATGPGDRSATPSDGMVGRRIKALRLRKGLTQKQVACRVGVTGPQFHRYEVGTTRVATSRLLDIAAVLGVEAEALMQDQPPPAAPQIRPTPAPAPNSDLVELVEAFSAIEDRRRRAALINFARCLAARPPGTDA